MKRFFTAAAFLVAAVAVGWADGNFRAAQVTVTTTATQIIGARQGRVSVTITNLGATDVYIGDASVVSNTGHLLNGAKGASITLPATNPIYGITGTGSQRVSVIESY